MFTFCLDKEGRIRKHICVERIKEWRRLILSHARLLQQFCAHHFCFVPLFNKMKTLLIYSGTFKMSVATSTSTSTISVASASVRGIFPFHGDLPGIPMQGTTSIACPRTSRLSWPLFVILILSTMGHHARQERYPLSVSRGSHKLLHIPLAFFYVN